VAAPFRVAEFDIMFNQGISKMGDLLDIGVNQGFVKKAGSFYSYGETRLGQGRENSKSFLSEHPDIAETIEALIRGEEEPGDAAGDEVTNGYGAASANGGTPYIAGTDGVSLN
jgi:recombination protein RecA